MADMILEIQATKGYVSFSAVVHSAVIELHHKTFPTYVMRQPKRSPTEKVHDKAEEKAAKESIQRDVFLKLADELGGTVVMEAGKEFCKYFTYTHKKRYEQKIPLQMLSTDLVKTQYQPSREKVEQLQKEGKTEGY